MFISVFEWSTLVLGIANVSISSDSKTKYSHSHPFFNNIFTFFRIGVDGSHCSMALFPKAFRLYIHNIVTFVRKSPNKFGFSLVYA